MCLLVCKYVGQSFSILVCTSFYQIVSIMFVLMCLGRAALSLAVAIVRVRGTAGNGEKEVES